VIFHFVAAIVQEVKEVVNWDIRHLRDEIYNRLESFALQQGIPSVEEILMCFVMPLITISALILHDHSLPREGVANFCDRVLDIKWHDLNRVA
jgi:hypothetical protein